MSSEQLWLLPMALIVAVLAAVAVLIGQREAGEVELGAVLGAQYVEAWSDGDEYSYEASARLGEHEEKIYFAALRGREVCFIVQLGEGVNATKASTCGPASAFERRGAALGVSEAGGPPSIAYLLPPGYEDAAAGVTWGRVLSPNLLVVEDIESYGGTDAVELAPSDSRRPVLTLQPMGMVMTP